MLILKLVFWFCLAIIAWETLLFPAVLWLLAHLRPRPSLTADITPLVSFIISTHNEAAHIADKMQNTLSLDYPREQLEILVADDSSTDDTANIVESFKEQRVSLIRQAEWRGKTAAQNLAAASAKGEILLFSDATAFYNAPAVRALVRHFADPKVGCVTGRVSLGNAAYAAERGAATAAGFNIRLQYEQGIRSQQAAAISLFGATGCIYAVRRALYRPVAEDQVSDLVLPLMLLADGYRTVYEPEAVATLERPVSAGRELTRRSRVVLQCLRAMGHMRRLLAPWRAGLFISIIAWYRLLRWLLPFFLLGCLASNVALASNGGVFYFGALIAQLVLYSLALLGGIGELLNIKTRIFGLPFFFVWINVAAGLAIFHLLKGEKRVVWDTGRNVER